MQFFSPCFLSLFFPVLNQLFLFFSSNSQFYARPGTPAARMKQLKSQVVKDRSRRLTDVFNNEIRDPHRHLVGTRQRVWITEIAHDKHNLCGHTKDYVQVIVSPAEAALGTDCFCDIYEAGRFFVRGRVVVSDARGSSWIWWLCVVVAALAIVLSVMWRVR